MISRSGNKNFIAAHYEWLVVGVGVLALVGGGLSYYSSASANPEEEAAAERQQYSLSAKDTGVKALDMETCQDALKAARNPATLIEVSEKGESFLASERRVQCNQCKKAIPGDIRVCPKCPFCGLAQEEEKKVVLDADGDGLPDEWEKKFGLNPSDAADAQADSDNDGFTNAEEFAAKTDPKDPKDHPDYLDSLQLQLPLKETKMPFVFRKANKIPGGWRCDFVDPSRKNDYGSSGRTIRVKVGEKIVDAQPKEKVDYGFTLKKYTPKTEKRERPGMKGMFVNVDVSEVEVVRESDGKVLTLEIQHDKIAPASLDIQATLLYTRGAAKTLDVVPGSEIDLNGTIYLIKKIERVGKGAKVLIENKATSKKRVLEALEQ